MIQLRCGKKILVSDASIAPQAVSSQSREAQSKAPPAQTDGAR